MPDPDRPDVDLPGFDQRAACHGPTCITCSDAAVEVTVIRLLPEDMAEVDTGAGPTELVSVALVEARVGERVLVHAGEAIGKPAPATGP